MKANGRKYPDWYWEAIAEEEGDLPYGEKIRAALTPDEYRTLLAWIKEAAKKKRGRPPKVDVIQVASECLMYEGFLPPKVALAITAEAHGISRASVFAAKRKFRSK
jgi:hypothetical protein